MRLNKLDNLAEQRMTLYRVLRTLESPKCTPITFPHKGLRGWGSRERVEAREPRFDGYERLASREELQSNIEKKENTKKVEDLQEERSYSKRLLTRYAEHKGRAHHGNGNFLFHTLNKQREVSLLFAMVMMFWGFKLDLLPIGQWKSMRSASVDDWP